VSADLHSLRAVIEDGTALVGILGLGHVGVPLARAFITASFDVLGFDTDPAKVARLQQGESYLGHVSGEVVRAMRAWGFEATGDLRRLSEPDALLICVPTPLTGNREPDLSHVMGAAQACADHLRRGQLVVLESTTYPGTTRRLVLPILEGSGLRAGEDFFLAYSPEREDPGNRDFSTRAIPKVVGAVDAPSREVACALYERVISRVVPVSSAEVAEGCKLLENTYRAVNIALVNEVKVLYGRLGIDVWEVIEAARTKPFGFQAFSPGPGVGGQCIPTDPFYLAWAARQVGLPTRLVEAANEINEAMPEYVARRLAEALSDWGKPLEGSRVALLGVAYKRDVSDCRDAPSLKLMDLLCQAGASVSYHDPFVPNLAATGRHPELAGESQPLTTNFLASQDAVVIVTDHSGINWSWVVEYAPLVIDTRNATRNVSGFWNKIVRA
jgi:UDP-N-acetyl-D-glucosamine dehydrogenase